MKKSYINYLRVSLMLIGIVAGLFPCPAREIFVNPNVNDAGPGTKEQPLKTIVRARDKVRELNRTNNGENITVWLAGGEYRLSETLFFGLEDGAKNGQTISYSALPGEKPVINSDVTVTGWKKLGKMPKGFSKAVRGKIWVAKVPDDVKSFNTLYNSQQMLPRASTNGMRHLRKVDSKDDSLYNSIPLNKAIIQDMFNPKNAEIVVIPGYAWVMNILPVKSVNYATGMVTLGAQSTYPLCETRYFPKTESIWVENTFAGLDKPGEWVFDQDAKLLYYWPLNDKEPGDDVVIPELVEMIKVEGKINYDGTNDIPVKGLHFRGLTFTHGNRFESAGQTGRGLQHDWDRFDASTALVRFRGAENCVVDKCTFFKSGGAGIRFDLFAQNNQVTGNDIYDLGGGGVLFAGYGPGTKDVNIFYATQENQPFVFMQGIVNTIDNINTDGNIFFNSSDPKAADTYLTLARKYANEVHSIQSDPLFKDAEKGDFTLLPDSPAIGLGFRPFKINAGVER